MHSALPRVKPDGSGYENAQPELTSRTFRVAMSFHAPENLAAVADDSGAFHIDPLGRPAYEARFTEAFGFYDQVATVRDEGSYFHIGPDGEQIHGAQFRWAGNFQGGYCVVQDDQGFHHVDRRGRSAYAERYAYAGDVKYGIAVVHTSAGASHIRMDGRPLHERWFLAAEPFHKGHAVVCDPAGWHHVDHSGEAAHEHRFRSAEPFYNGVALCSDREGRPVRLRENGYYQHLPAIAAHLDAQEIKRRLDASWSVGLLTRHAERHPITDGWGNEAPLTSQGIEQARRFGGLLARGHPLTAFSSPVERCVQTATLATEGAGCPQQPRQLPLLGDPGPFHDPQARLPSSVGPRQFGDYATRYMTEGRAQGFRPLEIACTDLLHGLLDRMGEGLTLFSSHDIFVGGLASFLGLKHVTRSDWADYLEAVCISKSPEGSIEWHRFLGLEELAAC